MAKSEKNRQYAFQRTYPAPKLNKQDFDHMPEILGVVL